MELGHLEIRIARSENLPVLPQHVSKILKLADKPQIPAAVLEAIAQRDPAVTAKVLRAANSPFYGLTGCTSVSRAMHALGTNQVRTLVTGVAYQQAIGNRASASLFDKMAFWRHSIATALGARILAKIRIPSRAEEMYDAGMMHDVGLLVMDKYCPEELDASIDYARTVGVPLHVAENALYGFDHGDLGVLLAQKWYIQDTLHFTTRHYELEKRDDFHEETCIIAIADAMACQSGYPDPVPANPVEVPPKALKDIEVDICQIDVIRTIVRKEVEKAELLMAA